MELANSKKYVVMRPKQIKKTIFMEILMNLLPLHCDPLFFIHKWVQNLLIVAMNQSQYQ